MSVPRLLKHGCRGGTGIPVRGGMRTGLLLCGLFACVQACWPCAARAEDQVILQRDGHVARTHVRGEVLSFTSRVLTVRSAIGDRVHTYAADEVLQVLTPHVPAFEQGAELFAQGRVAEADREFAKALNVESRDWVRRETEAMRIRCSLRLGDRRTACERFLDLVRGQEDSRHFDVMPLVWAPEVPDRGLQTMAEVWLSSSNPEEQLLAASLLLLEQSHVARVEEVLRTLVRGTHAAVRELAAAQQWRLRLGSGDISELELDRWESRVRSMPKSIRGPGFFLIGLARKERHEDDRAAEAFLWLPLVYDHNDRLAARAGVEAADALLRIQQRPEALVLYREIAERYADMPFGVAAAEQVRADRSGRKPGG